MSWENIMPLFQAGKVAMWTDASVFYGQIVDPAKSQVPADNVGIANFPAGPKANTPFIVVSWGMAMAKQSKNKDLAMKFLDWATEQGTAAKRACSPTSRWRAPRSGTTRTVLAKVNPGLVETRAFAAKNGYPLDRPYMSAVGEARDRDRRADHRVDQHQGRVAESREDGEGQGRKGERAPRGHRRIRQVIASPGSRATPGDVAAPHDCSAGHPPRPRMAGAVAGASRSEPDREAAMIQSSFAERNLQILFPAAGDRLRRRDDALSRSLHAVPELHQLESHLRHAR